MWHGTGHALEESGPCVARGGQWGEQSDARLFRPMSTTITTQGTDRQAGETETRAAATHSRMKKLNRRDATVGLQKRAVEGAGLSGSAATCPLPQKTCDTDKPCFRGDQTLRGPMLRESPCVAVVAGCQGMPHHCSDSGRCFEGLTYPTTPRRPNQTPPRQLLRNRQLGCDPSERRPLSPVPASRQLQPVAGCHLDSLAGPGNTHQSAARQWRQFQ